MAPTPKAPDCCVLLYQEAFNHGESGFIRYLCLTIHMSMEPRVPNRWVIGWMGENGVLSVSHEMSVDRQSWAGVVATLGRFSVPEDGWRSLGEIYPLTDPPPDEIMRDLEEIYRVGA